MKSTKVYRTLSDDCDDYFVPLEEQIEQVRRQYRGKGRPINNATQNVQTTPGRLKRETHVPLNTSKILFYINKVIKLLFFFVYL